MSDIKRTDAYSVAPDAVAMDATLRARHFAPTAEEVAALATSIFDNGQLQPAVVRKVAGGGLQITAGYTRLEAVKLIRSGFTAADGRHIKDAEFRLKVVSSQCNDDEAFKRAVIENNARSDRSPVNDAFNQEQMRSRYGWTNADIAKFYHCDPAHVSRLTKLLTLPSSTLRKLHDGVISFAAAVELSAVPAAKQAAVIEQTGGKVAEIKEAKRQTSADAAPVAVATAARVTQAAKPTDTPRAKGGQRTIQQVKRLLDRYTIGDAGTDETHPVVATIATMVLAFINAEMTEAEFESMVREIEGKKK